MDKCRYMGRVSFLLFRRSISAILSKNRTTRFFQCLIFGFLFVYLVTAQVYLYIYFAENVSWDSAHNLILFFTMLVTGTCFCMLIVPGILDAADYRMLLALPIDKRIFIRARVFYVFCVSGLWTLSVLLPATFMVIVCGDPGSWFVITASIATSVIATGCMVWLWIVVYETFRSKKGILRNVRIVIVLALFIYISFVLAHILMEVFGKESELSLPKILKLVIDGFTKYFVPLNVVSLAYKPEILCIVILLVFVIGCFAASYIMTQRYLELKKTEMRGTATRRLRHRKVGLFMREIWVIKMNKGYLRHLIIENILAPIIMLYLLGLVKICSLYSPEIGTTLDTLTNNDYAIYVALFVVMMVILSQSGCLSTVSREGKRYWIIRALPIAPEKLYFYKSLIVLIMAEFSGGLSFLVIILLRLFKAENVVSIYILLFTSIFAYTSVIGIRDYRRPYLSWDSVKKLTNGNPNIFAGLLIMGICMAAEALVFVVFRVAGLNDTVSNLTMSALCMAVGIGMYMNHYGQMREIFSSSSVI